MKLSLDDSLWHEPRFLVFCRALGVSRTVGVGTLVLDSGGHSFDTYAPTLPQSLAWLAQVGAIS